MGRKAESWKRVMSTVLARCLVVPEGGVKFQFILHQNMSSMVEFQRTKRTPQTLSILLVQGTSSKYGQQRERMAVKEASLQPPCRAM